MSVCMYVKINVYLLSSLIYFAVLWLYYVAIEER